MVWFQSVTGSCAQKESNFVCSYLQSRGEELAEAETEETLFAFDIWLQRNKIRWVEAERGRDRKMQHLKTFLSRLSDRSVRGLASLHPTIPRSPVQSPRRTRKGNNEEGKSPGTIIDPATIEHLGNTSTSSAEARHNFHICISDSVTSLMICIWLSIFEQREYP